MRDFKILVTCTWIVLLLCIVVLMGWQFDLTELRRFLANAPQTMPFTAVMLLFPGRSSPQTILSALFIGMSICLLPLSNRQAKRAVITLALLGMVIPWVALFGYVSAINPFYAMRDNPQTGISPLISIGFLILGIGIICAQSAAEFSHLFAMPSTGGQIIKRLLPVALITPHGFAWLVTYGRNAGFIDTATGFALSWGVMSLFFAALVIWQGVTLHEYDVRLKSQTSALAESNRDLQQFAYVVSHDLQTPLHNVNSFIQLLQQTYHNRLDKEANTWIDLAVVSIQHMQALIRNILAYSSTNSTTNSFVPVSLSTLFNEVMAILTVSIQEANAKVTSNELPTVMGDRLQFAQLLQNLIGNALKYQENPAPHVHVSAERGEGEWLIAIRDNGIGIEPQYQERIFEAFHRVHTQEIYTGTGIGLATCRRIVERHGGKIWVSSTLGQGSTFYFTIPDQIGKAS